MATVQLASTTRQNYPHTDRISCAPLRPAIGGQAGRARVAAVAVAVYAVLAVASRPSRFVVPSRRFLSHSGTLIPHRAVSLRWPLAQCGEREPLIGVRFSDRSRVPCWSRTLPARTSPRFLADLSGFWRSGYWTKLKRMLKCVSVGYEKTLRGCTRTGSQA